MTLTFLSRVNWKKLFCWNKKKFCNSSFVLFCGMELSMKGLEALSILFCLLFNKNHITIKVLQPFCFYPVSFICARAMPQSKKGLQKVNTLKKTTGRCPCSIEKKKLGTGQFAPNCLRTPNPTFFFEMLLISCSNLAQG